jgi:hypothetical protein
LHDVDQQHAAKRERKKSFHLMIARTHKQANTRGHQRVSLSSDKASWYVSLLHAQLTAMQQPTNMNMREWVSLGGVALISQVTKLEG